MKKEFRVKKSTEIDAIIHNKQSVGNKFFVVYYKENDKPHFRFSLSIGKKYGNAVRRNKIKRQIRAIISSLQIDHTLDLVIVIKKNAQNLLFIDIESHIKNLILKIQEMETKNETQ